MAQTLEELWGEPQPDKRSELSLSELITGPQAPTLEDLWGEAEMGLNERRANLFTQGLVNLLTYPNIGGPTTPEEFEQDYATNLARPDFQALSAKAGVPLPEIARPYSKETIRQGLDVPEATSTGQKVEDFIVSALPYVGAGAMTSPISTGVEAAGAAAGQGLLKRIILGQAAQEAAFVPSTLASSDSLGEAALVTGAGVGLGSLLGRLFAGARPKVEAPTPNLGGMDEEGLLGQLVKGQKEATTYDLGPQIRPDEIDAEIAKEIIEPGIPAGTPIEEMTRLAPTVVNGQTVTAGSPEGIAFKEEARARVGRIVATQQAAEEAAKKKWPGWTPEKETIYADLTAKGVSEAQAKHLLMDPEMAGRLAQNLRDGGEKELAEALEEVVGKPGQPEVTTLKDMLSQMGPEAAKVYTELAEDMSPSMAKRFVEANEAGFIRMGLPPTAREAVDRFLFLWRGNLLFGIKQTLGNATGNLIGSTKRVPESLLAATITGPLTKKLYGRGPDRYLGESVAAVAGFGQSLGNLVRKIRKEAPAGLVGPSTRRLSEMTRVVRLQIEGKDPFNVPGREAGTLGQVISGPARFTFKTLLGKVDQAFHDFNITSLATQWAYRTARQRGAQGFRNTLSEVRRLLTQMEKDSLDTEMRAAAQSKELIPKLAKQRAKNEAEKQVASALATVTRARKTGIKANISEAEQMYRETVARADKMARETFDLSAEEKEFIRRSVARDLMPADLKELTFLSERALLTAREGKTWDAMSNWLQTGPARDFIALGVPYVPTPMNGVREAVRSSPVGYSTAFVKLLQAGGYGDLRAQGVPFPQAAATALKNADDAGLLKLQDDLAQATLGTMLAGGTLAALAAGYMRYNQDGAGMRKEERLALEAQGIPTDSISVGNFSVPLYRIEPIGRSIRMAARMFNNYQEDPSVGENAAQAVYDEFIASTTNDLWLEGIGQLHEAMTDENAAASLASKLGGAFVPRLAGDVGAIIKGERVKRPESVLGALIHGPETAVGSGKTDLGLFGKPRKVDPLFQLTGTQIRHDDPLLQELTKIGYFPTTRLPKIDLSEGESQDAIQAKGFAQEQALKRLIANPSYQDLRTPELKRKALEKRIQQIGGRADKIITARKKRGMSLSYGDLLQALVGQ